MMNSKKTKISFLRIISILLFLIVIFSGIMFAKSYLDGQKDIEKFAVLQKEMEENPNKEGEDLQMNRIEQLKNLHAENPDLFGWIEIEGTSLNYPVMYTPDDPEFYLRKDFEKEYSISGVPFIGAGYLAEGRNTIIYGHNMANGTLFSALSNYKDKKYWEENPVITYETLEDKGKYEIFAMFNIDVEEAKKNFRYHEYNDLRDPEKFMEYIDHSKERTFYDTGIEVNSNDEILTLSTCSYHTADGRSVVLAKRIE